MKTLTWTAHSHKCPAHYKR